MTLASRPACGTRTQAGRARHGSVDAGNYAVPEALGLSE
jgi:hypothetical protein